MKKILVAVVLSLSVSSAAMADEYHVYKMENGECEVDSRAHDKMKDQKGSDNCLGHFSSYSSASDLRSKKVKEGECKCPSGQNC